MGCSGRRESRCSRRADARGRFVLRSLDDLARRCRRIGGVVLFAVDHHRGSEENQAGWDHHDTEVVDRRIGKMDTLPFFRAAIHDAGLEDSVIAVVGRSPLSRRGVDHAAVVPVHRWRSRRGTRTARLRGLDAARRRRRHARDPRRVPRSGRRWASAVRADLPAGARVGSVPAGVGDRFATRAASCRLTPCACDQAPYWRTTTKRFRST